MDLQEVDLNLLRSKKKFDGLSQRRAILALREKRKAIEAKQAQVAALRKEAEQEVARIDDEDERLQAKQAAAEEKIAAVKGDYRAVEAHTKELGGIAKRRNTLESELAPLGEKITQIEAIEAQVAEALGRVVGQEEETIASFQEDAGLLSDRIAELQATRDAAFASLEAGLADAYSKKVQRCGGIAVARLSGNLCSVCRNMLEEGKLLQVQGEAPLSECPYCRRMMVVLDD